MKRLLSLLTVFCLCLALIAPSQVEAATLKLNKTKTTLEVDSTLKLKLGVLSGTDSKWTTSSKKIATVSKDGVIIAKSEGTANITATYKGKEYTCNVTVVNSNTECKLSDDVNVMNVYRWSDGNSNFIAFDVINFTASTVSATFSIKFLDENGKFIDAKTDTKYAIGKGQKVLFLFEIDQSFASYDYSINAEKDPYFSSVYENLFVSTGVSSILTFIQIANNGDVAAQLVEYNILYLSNGKVVDYGMGYCVDEDSEIKPGKTVVKKDIPDREYDSIEVYVTGRVNK
jgi:hypothetical protein